MSSSVSQESCLKPPRFRELSRARLQNYFFESWTLNELLFSSITDEKTLYLNPDPLRNPLIFYLGHTAAFYINKLRMAGILKHGIDSRLDQLFAVGVDPDTPENLEVADLWPEVSGVIDYRNTAFRIVSDVIANMSIPKGTVCQTDPIWALLMALEHDRIHFETSSVLIRQLPAHLVNRPEGWNYAPTLGEPRRNFRIESEGGIVQLGKPDSSDIFGWDNEYGDLTKTVAPFSVSRDLISNRAFLEFVQAGGYESDQYWTKEGHQWKERTGIRHPKFWIPTGNGYAYRAMFDHLDMPFDWPAEVNAHEAMAYCRWKQDGSRLLTEAEYTLLARENLSETTDPEFSDVHNLHFVYGSPGPVGFMKDSAGASGVCDLYGNVWDWLADDFYPLPGFKTHPLYRDFSEPYMDMEHGMMAGGSWATTGTGASKYYRLWFRRHFFQHAGFRLAKTI